jgi:hypothetical protein
MKYLLKARAKAKGSHQKKIPLVRKSYSLHEYLQVMLQQGVDDVGEDHDE